MSPTPGTVGLVLSGGGARSSFQIGALRYLYDEVGIAPSVITGTSAGSILGAVLAQGADHDAQRARLDQLETLWREMRDSSDMFSELPWFARLRERGPVWMAALDRRRRRQGALGRSFKRVADLRQGISAGTAQVPARGAGTNGPDKGEHSAEAEHAEEVTAALAAGIAAGAAPQPSQAGNQAPTAGGQGPTAGNQAPAAGGQAPTAGGQGPAAGGQGPAAGPPRPTGPATDAGERQESPWVPAKLLESIDMLRTVGRAGSDLDEIVAGAQQERSMFSPGPIVGRLVDRDIFDPAAVAASGVVLRIAVVGLESGELRYVTESGTLVDRRNEPVEEGTSVELVEAVRASCAIPMVFPPVRLGQENYVDGGVRESLPAAIATEHLGVDTCYAVVAGPSDALPREGSYDDKDMFAILLRTTTAIMTDEVQRDEVVHARAAGAVVIEPELDVHDTLTVIPGLVSIAIDYGYLRAAEAHQGASAAEQALTREIILLRRRIWRAEEEAFAPETAGAAEGERLQRVAEITGLKLELRDQLRQVPARRLPKGAEQWWRGWEAHEFQVPVAPSWAP